ncbi:ankyrin repeat-containing domain protein [Rhexocercosporidium sp. MPI-PUGE-AT-0058]|nr:ankyrin repeat-containing domain protein [Rhexocercosporidium sp. MPI-PUGE-AT-0058]
MGESSNGISSLQGSQGREVERLRRVRIEAVSSQWNEGFFAPRGLQIIINVNGPPATGPTDPVAPRRSISTVLQKRPPPEAEETLLHQAVGKGKRSQVKQLLDKGGEDLEALNKKIETSLFRAVSKGDKDVVQLLLEYGADPNARPPGAESPLHIACSNDKKTIVKYLVDTRRVDVDEPNAKGETPLYSAVLRRQKDCIEVLLDAGANPNVRPLGQDSETPLSIAVNRGDKGIVAVLLDQEKIDLETEDEKHRTPLWTAVYRGHTTIAELLLRKGAYAGKSPVGEETLLNLAVVRGSTSLTHLLLEKGADPEEKSRSNESPVFQAVCRGDAAVLSLLLGKGASPDTRNTAGETALQRAVYRSDTSAVSLLLGAGANPDLQVVSGETPLYMGKSCSES